MNKQDTIQEEIVNKTLKFYETNNKGWINGAMRLGKIRICLSFLSKFFTVPQVLICYKDNKIENSWREDIIKWQYTNPYIKFVNFSSLKHYTSWMFDIVICDEFHSIGDNQKDKLEQIVHNSKYSLFLSGTISNETKKKWPEFKEIAKYTTNQGIEDQILSDYTITVHLVDLDTKIKTPNSKGKLKSEKNRYDDYGYVMKQFRENGKDYMHLSLARNRISISSIGKKEYLLKLLATLKDLRCIIFCGLSEVADNLGIPSYHSKSPDNSNFEAFQRKEFNHLALVEAGGIGVSYIDLDCVILLNFVGNAASTSQKLNRSIKLDYLEKCADLRILCLREKPERNKLRESLSMLDQTKIKYV